MKKMLLLALGGLVLLGWIGSPARADHGHWGIGINLGFPGGYGPCYHDYGPRYYYYRPYPVYVAPPPVIIQSAPVIQQAPVVQSTYPTPPPPVVARSPVAANLQPEVER